MLRNLPKSRKWSCHCIRGRAFRAGTLEHIKRTTQQTTTHQNSQATNTTNKPMSSAFGNTTCEAQLAELTQTPARRPRRKSISKRSGLPRAILTKEQVVSIFEVHLANESLPQRSAGRYSAATVAKNYGVCEKAVRDIWNGRTWFRETNRCRKNSVSCKISSPTSLSQPINAAAAGKKELSTEEECEHIPSGCSSGADDTDCSDHGSVIGDAIASMECDWALLDSESEESSDIASFEQADGVEDFQDPFHDDWPYW